MQTHYRARARDPFRRRITNMEVGYVRFKHIRYSNAKGNTDTV